MSEQLIALYEGHKVGVLYYKNDSLSFEYSKSWQGNSVAFPISLSMSLNSSLHKDSVVRPFIEGLLPDNASVLDAWGKRFQVSSRNPFRLLCHVGEECAGAIQFVLPGRVDALSISDQMLEVDWLSDEDLHDRLNSLKSDHSLGRRAGDQGHFSLAGAQPKTGLYFDEENQRWGVPYGMTPTTHILKPNLGGYSGYDVNEHFCLKLVERVGQIVTDSSLAKIAGIATIIVNRYDRVRTEHGVRRVHQEDFCQALAYSPTYKYQNEGGPSPKEIFSLIRNSSSEPAVDAERFLNALILNWMIGGTDAHAKNYSFLIAGNGQVRLAPVYDISSCLPYPKEIPLRKAKLAMKVASEYKLYKITLDHWRRVSKESGYSERFILDSVRKLSELLIQHAIPLANEMSLSLRRPEENNILPSLANTITERAKNVHQELDNLI